MLTYAKILFFYKKGLLSKNEVIKIIKCKEALLTTTLFKDKNCFMHFHNTKNTLSYPQIKK